MKNKTKNIVLPILSAAMIAALSCGYLFGEKAKYSESERRALAKFPVLSPETAMSGKFSEEFETYSLDNFPLRDQMRSLKAMSEIYLFGSREVNGFYLAKGHIAKKEYPQNDKMLGYAAEKFSAIYKNFIDGKEIGVYFAVIPDKSAFLAEDAGMLCLDYEKFAADMQEKFPEPEYIDISHTLSADSYYTTDPHWRQEKTIEAAETILSEMNGKADGKNEPEYETITLETPFYGAYYGQAALPKSPDAISYLTNPVLEGCTVEITDNKTGKLVPAPMYDLEKAAGRDPYEMFLCGSQAVVVIENPNAESKKELVVFRDSFGSSIAPLFAAEYSKITLIDIRYISNSAFVGAYADFDKTDDVLFLYSTLILNNSTSLK